MRTWPLRVKLWLGCGAVILIVLAAFVALLAAAELVMRALAR